MKANSLVLKEYVARLTNEDLDYLYSRTTQLFCGDRAEVVSYLSQYREIDRLLSATNSSDELFDIIDEIGTLVAEENKKRLAISA